MSPCPTCQTPMRRRRRRETSELGGCAWIILLLVCVLLSVTLVGAIVAVPVGIAVFLAGPFFIWKGGRRVWVCPRCRVEHARF